MKINSQLRIAITGAQGQLGQQLVSRLSGKVNLAAYDKAALDISSIVDVNRVLSDFRPNIIINSAAYTAVDKAEIEQDLADKINHIGVRNLASTATELNAIFIHLSTDYVFDGNKDIPYVEDDRANPQSEYGRSKLAGELATSSICSKFLIIRTSWVFSESGNNFVKTMLRIANLKPELGVVADQIGGPTYAGDIADAIIEIVSQLDEHDEQRWGIYHFCGYPFVSWFDFSKSIFDEAQKQNILQFHPKINSLSTDQYPTPARRPAFSMLDCAKIYNSFGIVPSNWLAALENLEQYK